MNILQKLIQTIKKVPPTINSPVKDKHFTEFAVEPYFEEFKTDETYKNIALELWRIIEDIEKAEVLTKGDNPALRSLIKNLTDKRHLYMSIKEVETLIKEKVEEIKQK